MVAQIRAALVMLLTLTLLTGLFYPLAVTGLAQLVFPHQANGSLIRQDGTIVGSELIGQSFSGPEWFWSRLSATGPVSYNAAASTGSNYGPMHPALEEAARGRIAALEAGGLPSREIPADLLTASGSGLDPHISPAAAMYQAPRVAKAHGLSPDDLQALIEQHTAGRQLGLLGEPRVNVLQLNLALKQLAESR